MKFLLPVDGSECSLKAVDHLIGLAEQCRHVMAIHLLNVREPADVWEVRSFLNDEEVATMQQHEGELSLQTARARLESAGLAHEAGVRVGPVAQTIVDYADELGCDYIVLGTRCHSALASVLMGSVAAKVASTARVPVILVH